MKCPVCKCRACISIGAVDGYAQDARECIECGSAWTFVGDKLIILD
jgi:Zn ribbon nucleic-acid-binding protein